ncbi:SipW-dependent-type signal peptide-containing protein [Natronococcus sp. A-GB1]|uniref:SipW-dependent-type signal peptide-containing protein n=1 Tax=Natronococcus sp. A-GB1 TaxID=3037648 RepID=UPI002420080E|nr:SipW-dependent-type signal peptide-containing protein [Natronococcus sp. A-GB1]MDG5759187.1 SipW-dependent-type signal peptide-containing protein [Natronococcus sp. A-GB1]
MTNNGFEISRRKALAGLGMVGVASAGAGLGTTAYFSDQEEFEGNRITAGEFGLTVEGESSDLNVDESDLLDSEGSVFADGVITIDDAKPGDEYEFCWEITVHDNPGYVALGAANADDQNGKDAGNLDELPHGIKEKDELSTLGEVADVTISVNGETVDASDVLGGTIVPTGDGEDCHDPEDPVELCVEIIIPPTVGNEIQGAEASWDLLFYAEQCRHNNTENVLEELDDGLDELGD